MFIRNMNRKGCWLLPTPSGISCQPWAVDRATVCAGVALARALLRFWLLAPLSQALAGLGLSCRTVFYCLCLLAHPALLSGNVVATLKQLHRMKAVSARPCCVFSASLLSYQEPVACLAFLLPFWFPLKVLWQAPSLYHRFSSLERVMSELVQIMVLTS